MKKYQIILPVIFFVCGCGENFLDLKSNKRTVVPSTIMDYQAFLDNTNIFNSDASCRLAQISSDDFYTTTDYWKALANAEEKNGYMWAADIFEGGGSPDWNQAYQRVLYANIVLEGIVKIKKDEKNTKDWNNVKGSALFYRAWALFQVAQLFCDTYSSETSNNSGIPLRLSSDVNEKTTRATVQETYERMVLDLQESELLLPQVPLVKTRPSRPAARLFLARIFLQMNDIDNALMYADLASQDFESLIDFNTLDVDASYPFEEFGKEVIFHDAMRQLVLLRSPRLIVDSLLYDGYQESDLRRALFYFINSSGNVTFKGSYNGSRALFVGLATPEIYLIKAECLVRKGRLTEGLNFLDALLTTRYISGTYSPNIITNHEDALKFVLAERRKEMAFRGMRWSDLKRLNNVPSTATIIKRQIDGTVFTLLPGDKRYIMPIPEEVVHYSGIEQNER